MGVIKKSYQTFCCVVSLSNNELTFSPILHNKRSNKRLQHAKIVMSVRANFADIYLRRMRDRSMEIQLTDWSIANKPV